MEASEARAHQGRNVKRIREMLGIKQEALALDLGISQQAISQLEQREALEREMLEKIAGVLKVSPEAIESFSEEKAITIISNSFHDDSVAFSENYKCTFNPLDKVVQLYDEKIALYERMLRDKQELIERLEKALAQPGK